VHPGQSGTGEDDRFGIELEFGPVWFSKNDVRVPGDTGTQFDMTDLTGSGPDVFARLDGFWNINDRHGLRIVLAPLEVSGTGELREDTDFAGAMDTTRYTITLDGAQGPLTVTVELLYQSIGFRWAENMRQYDAPEPARFLTYYGGVSNQPVTVASATIEVGQ
jgi:hypothetical protein